MFLIKQTGEEKVYLLNDINDVIDLSYSFNIEDKEIEKISSWLNHATFGLRYLSDNITIMCLTDEEAKEYAYFFGVEAEYKKYYGGSYA